MFDPNCTMVSATWLEFNINFYSGLMILALYFLKENTTVTPSCTVHCHLRFNISNLNEIDLPERYKVNEDKEHWKKVTVICGANRHPWSYSDKFLWSGKGSGITDGIRPNPRPWVAPMNRRALGYYLVGQTY